MSNAQTDPAESHYQRIGGAPTVQVAVDRFYQLVLQDPQLAHYFDGVDLPQLKRHQALVIGNLLGGPAGYDGVGLAAAHSRLAITDADFDKVGHHLMSALGDLGVGDQATEAVSAALAGIRAQIVTA